MDLISNFSIGVSSTIRCIAYSQDDEYLATQADWPDYLLTIWHWKDASILLRAESFSARINNIQFSNFNQNILITGGLDFIRFWDMSTTFTGLKLQCEDGRFGRSVTCDILGICPLNLSKTLSNNENGNILIWEYGVVKFEMSQKNRRPCHQKMITQIVNDNDRIITIGLDGFVRIWFRDTIENACLDADEYIIQIDPIVEYDVGNGFCDCGLISIDRLNKNENLWFCQDSNGAIWKCKIDCSSVTLSSTELIFKFHAGTIVDAVTCPHSNHIATLEENGILNLFDLNVGNIKLCHKFHVGGQSMIWTSFMIIFIGFNDGMIRLISVNYDKQSFSLVQAIKPHNKPIVKVTVNEDQTKLVSSSEDCTIFIFNVLVHRNIAELQPFGLVNVPFIIKTLVWNPLLVNCLLNIRSIC